MAPRLFLVASLAVAVLEVGCGGIGDLPETLGGCAPSELCHPPMSSQESTVGAPSASTGATATTDAGALPNPPAAGAQSGGISGGNPAGGATGSGGINGAAGSNGTGGIFDFDASIGLGPGLPL